MDSKYFSRCPNPEESQLPSLLGVNLFDVKFHASEHTDTNEDVSEGEEVIPMGDVQPFSARYLVQQSDRTVVHVALRTQSPGLSKFRPGDAIGFQCENRTDDIEALLSVLRKVHGPSFDPDVPFTLM